MKPRHLLLALALVVALPVTASFAQSSAGRTVRIIVPLPAGSSNDYSARTVAPVLSKILGQNVVVDNKAGANGNIAMMDLVRAAPDGLTLMIGSNSPLAANVAFVKNLPYDLARDITPIAGVTSTNHVVMVRTSHPVRTFAEFIAYAKARPGKVSVGSSTASVQLQIATMNKLGGLDLMTVPYKGTPQTFTDVIGGVLDATLTDPGNAQAQVKGGQMRALAVSSFKRNSLTPDWPAISETLPGFDFPSWNAFVGPANMPRDLVLRLSNAMVQALRTPEVVDQLARAATLPLVMNADEIKPFMAAETAKWVRLAREASIQPE